MNNAVFANQVGYIFDREHLILPEGSKASPSDFGKKAFTDLMQHHIVWL